MITYSLPLVWNVNSLLLKTVQFSIIRFVLLSSNTIWNVLHLTIWLIKYLFDKGPSAVDYLDPAIVIGGLEVCELLLLAGGGPGVGDLIESGLLDVGGHGGRQLKSTN